MGWYNLGNRQGSAARDNTVNDLGSEGMVMANKLAELAIAPDFELIDTHGNRVRLSDFRGKQPVVLVLLRGFM